MGKQNQAVAHFTGKASGNSHDFQKYEEGYDADIITYLNHVQLSNGMLRIMLDANVQVTDGELKQAFSLKLKALKKIQQIMGVPAAFIFQEPGVNPHYLFGILWQGSLLIINPVGLTSHKDFYQRILDAKSACAIQTVYLSNTPLQNENHLVSCGPICVELMRHITNLQVQDIFAQLSAGSEDIKEGLSFISISIEKLLPPSLKDLPKELTEYRQLLAIIRTVHLKLLENPFGDGKSYTPDDEKRYLDQCTHSPDQVFYARQYNLKDLLGAERESEEVILESELGKLKKAKVALLRQSVADSTHESISELSETPKKETTKTPPLDLYIQGKKEAFQKHQVILMGRIIFIDGQTPKDLTLAADDFLATLEINTSGGGHTCLIGKMKGEYLWIEPLQIKGVPKFSQTAYQWFCSLANTGVGIIHQDQIPQSGTDNCEEYVQASLDHILHNLNERKSWKEALEKISMPRIAEIPAPAKPSLPSPHNPLPEKASESPLSEDELSTPEKYEAWYQQITREVVPVEDLFSVESSTKKVPGLEDPLLQQIQQCLQEKYKSDTKIKKPMAEGELSIDSTHVNLALVEEEKIKSKSADTPSIPKGSNRLLIIGEAGVGKSFLSQYLAYQWSVKSLWGGPTGRFKAVFWVPLREILSYATGITKPFEEILIENCMLGISIGEGVDEKIQSPPKAKKLEQWINDHAGQVLFILDGYDEVADSISGNVSLKNFFSKLTNHPNVIFTSRPYHYNKIGGISLDQFKCYRNVGFKDEDIKTYVAEYFKVNDLSQKFLAWLWKEENLIVKSIAHVPLQLGTICWLWEKNPEESLSQLTLSALYKKISDERIKELIKKWKSESFSDAEKVLGKIAFLGIQGKLESSTHSKKPSDKGQTQIVYSYLQIKPILKRMIGKSDTEAETEVKSLFHRILKLGFFKSRDGKSEASEPKDTDTYYFVHLTYQEYYCARHLVFLFQNITKDNNDQIIDQFILDHKFSERFERIFWFIAGLLFLRYQDVQAVENEEKIAAKNALIYFFDTLQHSNRDLIGGCELGLLARCIEETNFEVTDFYFFSEIHKRLEAGFCVFKKSIGIMLGVMPKDLSTNVFLRQLELCQHVSKHIGFEDLVKEVADKRDERVGVLQESKINRLIESLTEHSNFDLHQNHACFTLGKLAPIISEQQQKIVLDSLFECLKNKYKVDGLHSYAADALCKFVKIMPTEKQKDLIQRVLVLSEEKDLGHRAHCGVVIFLGQCAAIIPKQQLELEAVINRLLRYLRSSYGVVQSSAVFAFGHLAAIIPEQQLETVISELLPRFESKLQDGDIVTVIDAAFPIRKMLMRISLQHKREVLTRALHHLATADNFYVLNSAARIFSKLVVIIPKDEKERLVRRILNVYFKNVDHQTVSMGYVLVQLVDIIQTQQREMIADKLLECLKAYFIDCLKKLFSLTLCSLLLKLSKQKQEMVINELLIWLKNSDKEKWRGRSVAAFIFGNLPKIIPTQQREAVISALLACTEDYNSNYQAVYALGKLSEIIPEQQREIVIYKLLGYLKTSEAQVVLGYDVRIAAAYALAGLMPIVSNKVKSLVIISLYLFHADVFFMKFHSLMGDVFEKILLTYPKTREFLLLGALTLFHSNAEARKFVLLSVISFTTFLGSSWQLQRLLFLAGAVDRVETPEDYSAVAFNQASLREVVDFLRLILSVCDIQELSERFCLLIVYLCFTHQLALTIEEENKDPYLRVHRQGESARIDLEPAKLESVLSSLRAVYCKDIRLSTQREQVFPEVKTLVHNQSFWRMLHVPRNLGEEKKFDSLISDEKTAFVSVSQWIVGVGTKEIKEFYWRNITRNFGHAFLILEGMDQYGHGIYLRYDLAIDYRNGTYRVYSPNEEQQYEGQQFKLADEEREGALKEKLLGGREAYFVTWRLDFQTEVRPLLKAVEADREKKSIPYAILGESTSTSGGKKEEPKEHKFNCLTWARDHIKRVMAPMPGDEKNPAKRKGIYDDYNGELEGISIPVIRIRAKEIEAKRSGCRLM